MLNVQYWVLVFAMFGEIYIFRYNVSVQMSVIFVFGVKKVTLLQNILLLNHTFLISLIVPNKIKANSLKFPRELKILPRR